MLAELGLRNFKAFGDNEQDPDKMHRLWLAPITLIVGPNSGGKSSIIQALMLLKQSHEARTSANNSPLELVPRFGNGEYLDLGSYPSLVHRQETARDLEIEIATENEIVDEYLQFFGARNDASDVVRTSVKMTFRGIGGSGNHELREVRYFRHQRDGQGRSTFTLSVNKAERNWYVPDKKSIDDYVNFYLNRHPLKLQGITPFERGPNRRLINRAHFSRYSGRSGNVTFSFPNGLPGTLEFPSERPVGGRPLKRELNIDKGSSMYDYHIDRLSHLGPLRQPPKRDYPLTGQPSGNDPDSKIGNSGQNTPYLLHKNARRMDRINEWLLKFEIPYEISVREYTGAQGTKSISLGLKDASGIEVGLPDVGFGINQFIPVILHGVVSRNGIICVEQPEIHLHPRLQAHIADLLIDTINAPSDSRFETGNQWIVETHSEMIVRRLQRRIREGTISNDDVSVLYVDPQGDGGSTIQRLGLDEDGRFIDEWPHGFFDEGYREIMGY